MMEIKEIWNQRVPWTPNIITYVFSYVGSCLLALYRVYQYIEYTFPANNKTHQLLQSW